MQQALVTRLMERQPSATGSFPGQTDTRTGATDGNGQSGDKWVWKVPMASACPCLHLRRVLKKEWGQTLPWLWLHFLQQGKKIWLSKHSKGMERMSEPGRLGSPPSLPCSCHHPNMHPLTKGGPSAVAAAQHSPCSSPLPGESCSSSTSQSSHQENEKP